MAFSCVNCSHYIVLWLVQVFALGPVMAILSQIEAANGKPQDQVDAALKKVRENTLKKYGNVLTTAELDAIFVEHQSME